MSLNSTLGQNLITIDDYLGEVIVLTVYYLVGCFKSIADVNSTLNGAPRVASNNVRGITGQAVSLAIHLEYLSICAHCDYKSRCTK